MPLQEFTLSGKTCQLFTFGEPRVLLVEPIDRNDLDFLGRETDFLCRNGLTDFALATFLIEDWNAELTPWKAAPVFGKEPFGDGAGKTLRFIEDALLPEVAVRMPGLKGRPVILGGYSLSALFALWAGYETDTFTAIAAASPSVWYPGWMDFAQIRTPKADRIYLSLGDAEERTRNRVMATVGGCIREQASLLERQGIETTLEWNPGNHFKEADIRTAKAFLWAANLSPKTMIEELVTYSPQDLSDLDALMHELSATSSCNSELLQAALAAPNVHIYVIREEGRIVATGTLCIKHMLEFTMADIESVVVSARCRGKGYGKALMTALITAAKDHKAHHIQLTSNPARMAANRLYQALGFEKYNTNCYKKEI